MITTTLSFTASEALSPDQYAYVLKTFNGMMCDLPTDDPEDFSDVPEHGTPPALSGKKRPDGSVDYAVTFESSQFHTAAQEAAFIRVLTLACQYMPVEWTFSTPMEKPECTLPILTRSDEPAVVTVADICAELPPEFREWADTESWERGLGKSEEEGLAIARGLVITLKPCIHAYYRRLFPKG